MITGKVLCTNCLYNVVNLAGTKVDKTCQLQEVSGNWRELVIAFSIALVEPDVVTTRKEVPQDRGEIYAVIHHSTTNFSSFRLSTVRGSLHLHGKWNAILFNYVVDPPTQCHNLLRRGPALISNACVLIKYSDAKMLKLLNWILFA